MQNTTTVSKYEHAIMFYMIYIYYMKEPVEIVSADG